MKTLVFVLFLAGISAALADGNLLKNGDFSSGLNHWEGDCHTPQSTTFDPSITSPPTTGVIVKLQHSEWAKVTQDFDGKVGEYLVTIEYSVSPDLKFSDRTDDYVNVPAKLEFSRLMPFNSAPGDWVVIINDLGAMHYNYWKITPKATATGTQTVSIHVQLDSDDSEKKGFYLVFPPGEGFINLESITLAPQGTASSQ